MEKNVIELKELETLVPDFAVNKQQLDDLKKVTDKQNSRIKELMTDGELDKFTVGNYVAVKSIRTSESFNTTALLQVIHKYPSLAERCIKTQEYVDMDELELAMYNQEVEWDALQEIDSCRTSKTTVALTVKKVKK